MATKRSAGPDNMLHCLGGALCRGDIINEVPVMHHNGVMAVGGEAPEITV